jgi:hypothetical protein
MLMVCLFTAQLNLLIAHFMVSLSCMIQDIVLKIFTLILLSVELKALLVQRVKLENKALLARLV